MANRIPERELVLPALELLYEAPGGFMLTSELIKKLEDQFEPAGEDNEILDGRHDTKFSQKVRNLKSHETLEKLGYADREGEGFRITDAGRKYVEDQRAQRLL